MDYRSRKFSDSSEAYKSAFGGGAAAWAKRGRFQLELLKHFGLKPSHTFLDLGCGALRGGQHFISYLEPKKYTGLDSHPDLTRIAKKEVSSLGLDSKAPVILQTANLKFEETKMSFDYILAFSVLNHLQQSEIEEFVAHFENVLGPKTTAVLTHGHGFDSEAILKKFGGRAVIQAELPLAPEKFGWESPSELFPIILTGNSEIARS